MGHGEKRKVEEGDDIDAERFVGGVEGIYEEFAGVCISEMAKMMETEKADEEYDWWDEVGEQLKDAKVEYVLGEKEVGVTRREAVGFMESWEIWSLRKIEG